MKSTSLILLALLCSAPALSADVTYGGPYSQLKVKLCSDTPPSRSLLPEGSLTCDDNPPQPDSYCTASWNYADTDIFNCGSETANPDDLNNNGIPDNDEDWDGDGLVNGVDPNPTLNDNVDLDSDNNGIPDKLDPFFDLYKASRPELIKCDAQDPDCQSSNTAIYSLSNANRDLTNIINLMAEGNTSKKFTRTLENLRQTMTFQEGRTRKELQDIERAINNIDGGVDNSRLIKSEFSDVDVKFSELHNQLDAINDGVLANQGSISALGGYVYEAKRSAENAADAANGAQDIANQVLNAVNNLEVSGGGGLTADQQRQLKNAAKSWNNPQNFKKLFKANGEIKSKLNKVLTSTSDIKQTQDLHTRMLSSAADDAAYAVNQELGARIDQLSDQIGAISGGTSTVDLSGVQTSIDGLSGKVDGLTEGVNDIGELLKEVDTSAAGTGGSCIETSSCQGFYQSSYDGGLDSIVTAQLQEMKTSVVDPFVSSFGEIDLSGAKRPDFGLPVPFYGYFSFDDYIDLDSIFGFLRFIFLASTAFYCRQIIFGG